MGNKECSGRTVRVEQEWSGSGEWLANEDGPGMEWEIKSAVVEQ